MPAAAASRSRSTRGSQPSSTATRSASSGGTAARSVRTPPSPENPRLASGLSTTVNRASAQVSSQALAVGLNPSGPSAPYTRSPVANRSSGSSTRSRSGPDRQAAPGARRGASRSPPGREKRGAPGAGGGPRRPPPPRRHRPQRTARVAGQAAQEAPRLHRRQLRQRAHPGRGDLHLAEPLQPPLRQRHLPLGG